MLFSIAHNGWQYDKLGFLKHQSFNLLQWLFDVKIFIFSTFCPIYYIACYAQNLFFIFKSVFN